LRARTPKKGKIVQNLARLWATLNFSTNISADDRDIKFFFKNPLN